MYFLERDVGERVVVESLDSEMRSINTFNNDPFQFYETPTVLVVSNQADDLRDVRQVLPEG